MHGGGAGAGLVGSESGRTVLDVILHALQEAGGRQRERERDGLYALSPIQKHDYLQGKQTELSAFSHLFAKTVRNSYSSFLVILKLFCRVAFSFHNGRFADKFSLVKAVISSVLMGHC